MALELEEKEATVKGLLGRLARQWEDPACPLLFEKGSPLVLSGLMVMVNDRIYTGTDLNRNDVGLRDRDRVSLLYFVSGG